MSHDPLCTAFLREFLAYPEIDGPEPDEFLCLICDLLAKVREDERRGMELTHAAIHRAAAVEAVKALYDQHDASCDEPRCEGPDREFAVAAIEALGGQQ